MSLLADTEEKEGNEKAPTPPPARIPEAGLLAREASRDREVDTEQRYQNFDREVSSSEQRYQNLDVNADR